MLAATLLVLKAFFLAFGLLLVGTLSHAQLPLASDMAFLVKCAGIALTVLLLSLSLVVRRLPVKVELAGLRCRDTMGQKRFVAWPDIASVRPIRLFGLPYVALRVSGHPRQLMLPLWLADMAAFRAAVRMRAGEEHALCSA